MKLAFIGTGYVGLVSGVMMAHIGHDIIAIDCDDTKIAKLKQSISPIYEAGLDDYLAQYIGTTAIVFSSIYSQELSEVEAAFVAVGTPSNPDGSANLTYLIDAVQNLASYLKQYGSIVIKSTVPPGTCIMLQKLLSKTRPDISIISNPEFLREGSAIADFLSPDRIVIGVNNDRDKTLMYNIYKPLLDTGAPILATDVTSAELIKYASNTFLANKIAFINEIADLCETIDADIGDVSTGIGLDKRIGKEFLKAGPGFGGSCFPKDILALQHLTKSVNCNSMILDALIETNNRRSQKLIDSIKQLTPELHNKTVALWGITYKAGTDDIRSSPAIKILELLEQEGCRIKIYDPEGMKKSKEIYAKSEYANSALDAARDCDIVILATEWPEFGKIDFVALKTMMKGTMIIDFRRMLVNHKTLLTQLGFGYYSIGNKYIK